MQMKTLVPAALVLALPGYAGAQIAPSAPVQASALGYWVMLIDDQLSNEMQYMPLTDEKYHGAARVKFSRGSDGTATDIALAQSSGNEALDVDAMNAVKRLHHIRPLPAGLPPNAPIVATLIYDAAPANLSYVKAMTMASRAEAIAEARIAADPPRRR